MMFNKHLFNECFIHYLAMMGNIYEFNSYRILLMGLVEGKYGLPRTRTELAKAMGCQATYLTQVLKSKAELTEDQGMKLAVYLEFDELETEYFLLLLRESRAGSHVLRSYLEQKRSALLSLHNEVSARIQSQQFAEVNELSVYYCSSWLPSVIHTATSSADLQTVSAISERLRLENSVVEHHLRLLEKFKLVKFESARWLFLGSSIHFPKNMALDQSFQINRRLMVIDSIAKKNLSDLHYSVVFSSDKKTMAKVRALFLTSIETLHKQVEPSPSEEIFSVCIDLFRA